MDTDRAASAPHFATLGAGVIREIIARDRSLVCELVRQAYIAFGKQQAIDPESSFLTFTQLDPSSRNRIIALPACLYTDTRTAGVKWIGSFPGNLANGLPRASAILVLNDLTTGFPYVCMEGSVISAARTAASAVIGAEILCDGQRSLGALGIVGTGLIADTLVDFFLSLGWKFDEIVLFDRVPERAAQFAARMAGRYAAPLEIARDIGRLLSRVELLVLTTTASEPYIHETGWLARHPRILNISLRDLSPRIVLSADNVVDDIDHCLRAHTSLHLAEQQTGRRDFINANLHDCLSDARERIWWPSRQRTAIFSPFGMGILDVAVGRYVYQVAAREGQLDEVAGFFTAATPPTGFPERA